MSECKHDLTPNYQGYYCTKCDVNVDQYEVIEQLKASEAECEDYKYDLDTLVSLVHDCVHNVSQDECYDILKEIDTHYNKLKEQG